MSEVHNIFSALHFSPGVMWHIQLTVWAVIRFKSIDDLSCGTRFCLFSTIICWRWDRNQPSETEQERAREREENRGKKGDNAAAYYLLQVTCVIFVLFVIIINMGMCLWATHVSQFSQLERSWDGERKTHQIALCSHYFNWISPSQHDAISGGNNAQNDEFSANQ